MICLSVDIDAASLLPADESGHGFDNVTVGDLPPALLDRYISAAQKISALAIGSTQTSLQSDIIRVPPDVTQEEHVSGLPIGTRGGVLIPYTFAQDGEYDIQIYLARGYSGDVDGLKDPQPHEIKLLLDRTPIGEFTVQRPANGDDSLIDRNLKIRVPVTAGPHQLGVTFLKNSSSLIETATPAPPVAVQRETSSAHHSGDFPGLRHRTIRAAGRGQYAEPPPDIRLPANRKPGASEAGVCEEDPLHVDAARVPSIDFRGGSGTADGVLSRRKVRARLRCGNRQSVERRAHQSRIPVPRGGGSGQDAAGRRLSHQRSRVGISPVIFSLEQPAR